MVQYSRKLLVAAQKMIESYFIKTGEKRKRSSSAAELKEKRNKERENTDEDAVKSEYQSLQVQDYKTSCFDVSFLKEKERKLNWKKVRAENLDVDYVQLFSNREADILFQKAEKEIQFNEKNQIFIHGKWVNIPRKQTSFGDDGLKYSFSGTTVFSKPWSDVPFLKDTCELIASITGKSFNFVLINRYKDGSDYIGEHRDDEVDLVSGSPIASLSLGQVRDFVFRHRDARGSAAKQKINPVKLSLSHGSLLIMNHPTNVYWYHSLPVRKKALCPRINMTFRQMVVH